jgi:hypothetical protein
MTVERIEAGRAGAAAARWRREPCPAELPLGTKLLTCGAQQVWNGPHKLHHDHVWAGRVGDQWVRVNWRQQRGES